MTLLPEILIELVPFKKTPPKVAALIRMLLLEIDNVLLRYVPFASTKVSLIAELFIAVCKAVIVETVTVFANEKEPENKIDKTIINFFIISFFKL